MFGSVQGGEVNGRSKTKWSSPKRNEYVSNGSLGEEKKRTAVTEGRGKKIKHNEKQLIYII